MGIDSKHPLYEANAKKWQKCRDTHGGEEAVKARGKEYLPKAAAWEPADYEAYQMRALFFEAVGRTVDGFVGAISRKDPVIEAPAQMDALLADATCDGMPLNELTKAMCAETILQGRGGLLVDWNEKQKRPYFTLYQVEAITNWSDDSIILHETVYEADPDDKFKQVAIEQYRELSLETGVYTVTVWRKKKNDLGIATEWVIHEPAKSPGLRGKGFDYIPFFWMTPLGKTSRVEAPPLLGLVNVTLSHYRSSADLEHGRHFSGLPTLVITGVTDPDAEVRVGGMAAIQLRDADAKVYYAEVIGNFQSLENALKDKQDMMATLGAAVFHDTPKGVEAAETARIRTSGETSLLVGVTTAVEATLKAALECAAKWMGLGEKIEITLNRDFVDEKLDGPTLAGLVAAFQAGALSLPQFLHNLMQGDLLAPDTDIEEEVAVVQAETAKRNADAATLAVKSKVVAK